MDLNIVTIPVSVMPTDGGAQVVGYRGGGTWEATLLGHERPSEEAMTSLFGLAQPFFDAFDPSRDSIVESVDFDEGDEAITFVYTVAVPFPLTTHSWGGEWIPLTAAATDRKTSRESGSGAVSSEPWAARVLSYWQRRLEQEPALFLFLPQVFTARQARDIYSAFWGYDQDAGFFTEWSGIGARGGALADWAMAEGKDPDIRDELAAALGQMAPFGLGKASDAWASAIVRNATQDLVGIDPTSVADAKLEEVEALTSASALVAFQTRVRGPKPTWYRQTRPTDTRQKLESLYSPRPSWAFPPASAAQSK